MILVAQKSGFNPELHLMRAMAVILVVLGHALEVYLPNPVFATLRAAIYSFHIPLFFVISGFFGSKFMIVDRRNYGAILLGQFKRLMVPYFFLSFLVATAKLLPLLGHYADRPFDISSALSCVLVYPAQNPMVVLWFLYTLFLMEALFLTLNRFLRLNYNSGITLGTVTAVLVALHLVSAPNPGRSPLVLEIVAFYAVFFFGGFVLGRYYQSIERRIGTRKYLFGLLAPLTLLYGSWREQFGASLVFAVVGVLAAWAAASALARREWKVRTVLFVIGDFAYDIYLYSYFVLVALRILMTKLLGLPEYWTFVFAILLPLFLPIVLSKYVLRKNGILRRLALGDWTQAPLPEPGGAPRQC